MGKLRFLIEFLDRKVLLTVPAAIFLLMTALPEVARSQESEADVQKLRRAAQEWMGTGIEQYRAASFDAAEQSFRQSQKYQEHLTAADRKKLDELLQKTLKAALVRQRILGDIQTVDKLLAQGQQLSKVEVYLQRLKNCAFLTAQERRQIAQRLKKVNHQPNEPEGIPNPKFETIVTNAPAEPASPAPVILQPGDEIEVKFFYTPELNVTQAVRPDGKIALELIGEVRAQGRTVAQLRDELLRLYVPYLKTPEVAVVVLSLYDRRVFVGGQVIIPGVVEMPGPMTALEAIMEAGGFDLLAAERQNVIVIRYKGRQRYAYKLDLEPATAGEETRPFFLEPEDIVYVPRTKIAKVNQWVDQHISGLIPRLPFYFSFPVD